MSPKRQQKSASKRKKRPRQAVSDRVASEWSLHGYGPTADRYFMGMSRKARTLFRKLTQLTTGKIQRIGGYWYIAREIKPVARGGLHPRFAKALVNTIDKDQVEFFAPKRAARHGMDGFSAVDISTLTGSADQGDVVFFRARKKIAMDNVHRFLSRSHLTYELSKGE